MIPRTAILSICASAALLPLSAVARPQDVTAAGLAALRSVQVTTTDEVTAAASKREPAVVVVGGGGSVAFEQARSLESCVAPLLSSFCKVDNQQG
ncbi:uncharacterized protein B0I36DRAFT_324639 [Microdochium trichocladiopsis]|uniref:Uncharacterized protein n=1 Tax=Microdochium trichocladiopsis TaxID=1682393 RepID=A0A9P9BLQ5_9PEZI|nr:uncharacterized protein B0I36DRAFT_324639 [Microdochium trichocladiopsis]KAH7028838.1 hypothetical protein B0I36DRAFT_324639 [Microdochium trichocladiopsis]